MATTKSIVDLDKLAFYICILERNGIISTTEDDYDTIAEAVVANFDIEVEYEDIKEFFKHDSNNIDTEDKELLYKHLGFM